MSAGLQSDLIAAVATAPGQGGIGVVRMSGPGAKQAGESICGKLLQPRQAIFCSFSNGDEVIDEGLALLFAEGASFTGEEVVELQGHGGPVVLQRLLNATLAVGARLAQPGEFSERAFLNGKLDLAQAEAIADLISSTSISAARAAVRSLQGAFSARVNELESSLAQLRVLVEACIDFPDEDVEFLQDGQVAQKIEALRKSVGKLLQESGQGRLLNEGASVAIIGAPNAGKSSLLNALSGEEAAIVTDIPGTTRDLLKVDLVLDGLPLRLVDTAGLRDSEDKVERIGVERARQQAGLADLLLVLVDASVAGLDQADIEDSVAGLLEDLHTDGRVLVVMNKQDLLPCDDETPPAMPAHAQYPTYWISAKTLSGLSELRRGIADALGFEQIEAGFTARARHVEALESAAGALHTAAAQLQAAAGTELVAEELRAAHMACGEIVGTVTPDELLGRIFSEFCIGK